MERNKQNQCLREMVMRMISEIGRINSKLAEVEATNSKLVEVLEAKQEPQSSFE